MLKVQHAQSKILQINSVNFEAQGLDGSLQEFFKIIVTIKQDIRRPS